MPHPRGNYTACVLDDRIYAFGGYKQVISTLATMDAYDPASDTWEERAPIPDMRFTYSAGTANHKIIVLFGLWIDETQETPWTNRGYRRTINEYDPLSNTWSTKKTLTTQHDYTATAVAENKLYLFGGGYYYEDPQGTIIGDDTTYSLLVNDWVQCYDPVADTLIRLDIDMPAPRWDARAEFIKNQIIVVGGRGDGLSWNTPVLSSTEALVIR